MQHGNQQDRYRFYREHKYLSYLLFELDKLIATIDFANNAQINKVKNALAAIEEMIKSHAAHEDKAIHELLKKKGSLLYKLIETEHQSYDEKFQKFNTMLHI